MINLTVNGKARPLEDGVDLATAKQAFVRVAHKMPVRCRFVVRRHGM